MPTGGMQQRLVMKLLLPQSYNSCAMSASTTTGDGLLTPMNLNRFCSQALPQPTADIGGHDIPIDGGGAARNIGYWYTGQQTAHSWITVRLASRSCSPGSARRRFCGKNSWRLVCGANNLHILFTAIRLIQGCFSVLFEHCMPEPLKGSAVVTFFAPTVSSHHLENSI